MIQTKRNFVFDFDSTLTSVEALDVLAEISLVNNSKKDEIIKSVPLYAHDDLKKVKVFFFKKYCYS